MKKLKWTTVSEYVDLETGEVLDKRTVELKYYITKKIRHAKALISTGIVTITNECKPRAEQSKLF